MSNNKQDHIGEANKMVTAVEWLSEQIDNELKVIDNLYGKEIVGRKIGFAFVKRILIEAKEKEKEQIIDAYKSGVKLIAGDIEDASNYYYNQTYKPETT